MEEDFPLEKVRISGPTLASMIQRFSSCPSPNVEGLLFGHVTQIAPTLSDDSPSSSSTATMVATVSSFLLCGPAQSFHDSGGRVHQKRLLSLSHNSNSNSLTLLGWFSARRRSPLRPSLRESMVSKSLSSSPCLFLLFSAPSADLFIHTHDYRAFQFRPSTSSFHPKSIDIVNIGPAFRGHYGSFSPNSPFPLLSPVDDNLHDEDSLNRMRRLSQDQTQLNVCAQGFDIGTLSRLMGSEASRYTAGLEDLYDKMLAKVQTLSAQVELSSAKVLEQENHNRKLRQKVADL